MSHPKIAPKTATAPEKPSKTIISPTEPAISGVDDSAFVAGSKKTATSIKATTATLPAPNDPTVSVMADQALGIMEVQEQIEDNPQLLTQPLDFIQQLRVQFAANSKAQLQDYTKSLPTVPPYSQLAPSINKISDTEEKKAAMRDIIIEYRRKLNTLRTMENVLKKDLGKVGNTTTIQEQAVQVRYAEILKKTINFCVQQYQHTVNIYSSLK